MLNILHDAVKAEDGNIYERNLEWIRVNGATSCPAHRQAKKAVDRHLLLVLVVLNCLHWSCLLGWDFGTIHLKPTHTEHLTHHLRKVSALHGWEYCP
jgi:hypothetical protein